MSLNFRMCFILFIKYLYFFHHNIVIVKWPTITYDSNRITTLHPSGHSIRYKAYNIVSACPNAEPNAYSNE